MDGPLDSEGANVELVAVAFLVCVVLLEGPEEDTVVVVVEVVVVVAVDVFCC